VLSIDEAVKCKSLFNFLLHRAELLGAFEKLRKATFSLAIFTSLYVRPSIYRFAWNNLNPTERFCMKYFIIIIFGSCLENSNFIKNLTIIVGTLHEDMYICVYISPNSIWNEKYLLLYYTVSEIITPAGTRPVHRSSVNMCTG